MNDGLQVRLESLRRAIDRARKMGDKYLWADADVLAHLLGRAAETIWVDAASIHAEMLRRHPEISPQHSHCAHCQDSTGPFARVHDLTGLSEGRPVCVADRLAEDYHGLTVEIVRWREAKP